MEQGGRHPRKRHRGRGPSSRAWRRTWGGDCGERRALSRVLCVQWGQGPSRAWRRPQRQSRCAQCTSGSSQRANERPRLALCLRSGPCRTARLFRWQTSSGSISPVGRVARFTSSTSSLVGTSRRHCGSKGSEGSLELHSEVTLLAALDYWQQSSDSGVVARSLRLWSRRCLGV